MMKKLLLFVLLAAVCPDANAQEESFPCKEANPALKKLFQGETLPRLYVHNCEGEGLHQLASSYLRPGGEPPKIIEHGDEPPEDGAYVAWTCKYSPGNLRDGKSSSAWVEGAKGQGLGEVLIVPCLDLGKPAKIWSGFGKSRKLHRANSRPKTLKAVVVRAESGGATQYGTFYENLKVVAEKKVTLKDLNQFQDLEIPDFEVETPPKDSEIRGYEYFLGLEILEVFAGSKYRDTCISEIANQ